MSRANRPLNQLDSQGRPIPLSSAQISFRGQYDANDNLIYAGFAKPGAGEGANVWQLMAMTYDANDNLLTIKWPLNVSGVASNDFEFNWSGRAGYTYA